MIYRLLRGRCELCQHAGEVQVHHIAKLAQLTDSGRPQPARAQAMAKRRRKTLVVCTVCHDAIHHRQPATTATE
ncbi:RNA-directed DNA polymerase [Amycolatopsis sp. NPDC059090]|uniref:HNH endonuclease n=1 Tax=Amycolatopsis sp. NPDC059090 TaxID=3346723 RepID=UPI00366D4273